MGEYWRPVNVTRKEFVHPHHVGCGLKLGEWWEWNDVATDSKVRRLISAAWEPTDDVRAVSDCGGEMRLWGAGDGACPKYDDLTDVYLELTAYPKPEPLKPVPIAAYRAVELRDWFAGQALAGMLPQAYDRTLVEAFAKSAYALADAMLAERSKP